MYKIRRIVSHFVLAVVLALGAAPAVVTPVFAQQTTVRQGAPSVILARLKQANNIPAEVAREIRILESDDLNAATNGEVIVFSQGLWNALQTEDQRAFVIAHELSHITLNHVPKTQARRVGLVLLGSALGHFFKVDSQAGAQLFDVARQLGVDLVDKRFSRSAELAADDVALDYMVNAGYSPEAALRVFKTLEREAPGTRLPEFLQSHPVSATRMQALAQQVEAYQTVGAPRAGRSAVQEVPGQQQRFIPAAQSQPSGQRVIILRQIR